MRLTKILRKLSPVVIAMLAVIIQLPASAQKPEKNEAYLFTYFTGNGPGEEAIRLAISTDGYNYRALNKNIPIIKNGFTELATAVEKSM